MKSSTYLIYGFVFVSLLVTIYLYIVNKTDPQKVISQEEQSSTTNSTTDASTVYTLADISSHNTESSCWMAISGAVYDVTAYFPKHNPQIVQGCGRDATQMFNSERKHLRKGTAILPEYKIGVLGN